MKLSIRPYGDNELEISSCIVKTRESAEALAANIVALAKRIWPDETDEEVKDKK